MASTLSLDPAPYVEKLNSLCDEGVAISKGVSESHHNHTAFDATKYSSTNFNILSLQQQAPNDDPRELYEIWLMTMQQARDAAGFVAQTYIDYGADLDIFSDFQERGKTIVVKIAKEFEARTRQVGQRLNKFRLDNAPGFKNALTEIENLLSEESARIVQFLSGPDSEWNVAIETLVKEVPTIVANLRQIVEVLRDYEIKTAIALR